MKNPREVSDDGLTLINRFAVQVRNPIQHRCHRFVDVTSIAGTSIRALVTDPVDILLIVIQRIFTNQDPDLIGAFWTQDAADIGAQLRRRILAVS